MSWKNINKRINPEIQEPELRLFKGVGGVVNDYLSITAHSDNDVGDYDDNHDDHDDNKINAENTIEHTWWVRTHKHRTYLPMNIVAGLPQV